MIGAFQLTPAEFYSELLYLPDQSIRTPEVVGLYKRS